MGWRSRLYTRTSDPSRNVLGSSKTARFFVVVSCDKDTGNIMEDSPVGRQVELGDRISVVPEMIPPRRALVRQLKGAKVVQLRLSQIQLV